ncbi:alcohol acetyltransferase [Massariosphaeria phaeospora]|uniref:Alcohol acetyltransferase n=1 Tax=Massariosphaeria phaeospora TaxID=100035 RepID=A0A7C8IB42_9PLEO|nr:alcohol acetyltransferase [Massariosphaeria phaeospora]
MADHQTLEKLRHCGHLEVFSTSRHHLGFYKNVGCTAYYTIPTSSTSKPFESLIYDALRIVIARHPILSAIPLNEDKPHPEAYFARLPTIDLRSCIQFVERKTEFDPEAADEELNALLAQQHNLDYHDAVGTKPFWRLVILRPSSSSSSSPMSFTASWIFHHALADGESGLVFQRTLLSALQTLITTTAPPNGSPLIRSPTTPLLPPLGSLHPLPLSIPFIALQLFYSIFPSLARARTLWTGPRITADPTLRTTRLTHIVFSPLTTQALVRLSRSHATTLTATVQCLIAQSLLSNLDGATHDRVAMDGPLSMRRFITLADGKNIGDEIGCFPSTYVFEHHRPKHNSNSNSKSFDWAEAQAVRAKITAEIAKNGRNTKSALLRWVSSIPKWLEEEVGKERSEAFEFSNIGLYKPVPGTEDDGCRIGRVVFSQCAPVAGAAFEVSAATGGDGCLTLAFSWLDGVLEERLMQAVIEGTRKGVEDLVANESTTT